MTCWTRVGLLALFGLVVGATGCWRADVFAITDKLATDGSVAADGAKPATCPSPALKPDDTRRTVKVDSADRSYVLHVPSTYDGKKPVPLILDFHMGGDSGSTELSSSPYPAVTDPEGVVMAFPDGKKGPAGAGTGWNIGPCCVEEVDDVAFAKALVTEVQNIACIDPDRVYAVGVGTGGGMAYYVACQAADVFAAVAPAAWDLLVENVGDCKPSRPITEISFRGTADTVVPYGGGPSSVVPGMAITFLGAKATFEKWAEIDRCTGSPLTNESNGCSTYSNCQDGVEVVLCTNPEGHQDPGNASVAWPLLKRHPL
jgi:polyhydroxybutyrate depolymerase